MLGIGFKLFKISEWWRFKLLVVFGVSQKGTFCSVDWSPGLSMMHAVMVPRRSMIAYMILEELEFLHDGQAWQQRPQAALPQQHASCLMNTNTIRKPLRKRRDALSPKELANRLR